LAERAGSTIQTATALWAGSGDPRPAQKIKATAQKIKATAASRLNLDADALEDEFAEAIEKVLAVVRPG